MSVIKLMNKELAEKIAAGEVVERPASIVKELVENSIDAGSSAVTVEIREGGVSFIRVTDNGCGILPEDMLMAFTRHATSKLYTEQDLYDIKQLGFRGACQYSRCKQGAYDKLRSRAGIWLRDNNRGRRGRTLE